MYACIYAPEAGALAQSFSPWVEMVDTRTAVFSIAARQMQAVSQLPRAAVASTIEAAILAARNFPGFTYLPPGGEARILGVLPVDALPPDPEIFETLDLWGVRSLADLARLPDKGVAERLGERGLWLQRLARGAVDRPLKPVLPAAAYEEFLELDHPLELLEPLLFLIARFLRDLCARLDAQSLAAGALRLTLNRQERVLRLPFPARDPKFLLKLIERDFEAHPAEEPIGRVKLTLLPTSPRRVQHGLFVPAAPEPEKLELTLGKIRALVGAPNVKTPEVRDTWRPGWGPAQSRLAFRYFRPALEARVETEAGVPKTMWTRVCRGDVLKFAGPWRSSGEWWRSDAWDRDEWDLAVSDGALYRVYRNAGRTAGRTARQWFLEGVYD